MKFCGANISGVMLRHQVDTKGISKMGMFQRLENPTLKQVDTSKTFGAWMNYILPIYSSQISMRDFTMVRPPSRVFPVLQGGALL